VPYNSLVYTFVETKLFTRLIDEYLSDEEFAALQLSLAANPEAGDVIKGSGGVRKLRWAGSGRGKRGGIRVIYYLRLQNGQIWLLTAYAKNVRDDIPAAVLRKIKEELDGTY
jgi:mRNA-degrading endonuclease RelE of RelBE toxin-antitoxin system